MYLYTSLYVKVEKLKFTLEQAMKPRGRVEV